MSGGGGGNSTTEIKLSPAAQFFQGQAIGRAHELMKQPPGFFEGPRRAVMDPLQAQAQQQALGVAGNLGDLGQAAVNSQMMMLQPEFLNLNTNPFLSQAADFATDPVFNRLQRDILPSARLGDVAVGGGPGGSAGAIERGLATGEAARAAMGIRGNIGMNAFNQLLGAQQGAIDRLGRTSAAALRPSQIAEQIGAFRRAEDQAAINEAMQRFQEREFQAENALDRFIGRGSQAAGLGTMVTTPPQAGSNLLGGLAGGGLAGLGTAAALPAGSVLAPFAIGGGLLAGALGGRF